MAFTGRLGTSDSQLGQIELGVAGGEATVETSFTADAVLLKTQAASFTADAVLKREQAASFTADAVISAPASAVSFTADAFIHLYFWADAVINAGTVSASFTADAVLVNTQSASFTADAVIVTTTRFYFQSEVLASVSPSFTSGWEYTADAFRLVMGGPQRARSVKADWGVSETSTSGTFDVLIFQFVSDPLPFNTVICGPAGGFLRATESNIAADDRSQTVIKVVSNDGTTLIGTLLDFDASALVDEWPTTSASRKFPLNYTDPGTNVTPVSASAGDRIVVEVGYRAHNTSSTSRTGTLRTGHTVGGTDFTAPAETADNNPWIDLRATTLLRSTEGSFTADALKSVPRSASFTTDAYIPLFRQRHIRTGPHVGVDTDLDHIIAWAFDRYLRGENLQQTLIDIDARLTAREGGLVAQRHLLPTDAILKALDQAASFTVDAYAIIVNLVSFAGDAFILPWLKADSWITDPTIYIDDSVLTAPIWPIDTRRRGAFISTASLTFDAVNDPTWWTGGDPYKTGWAKFTLASTKTVILDTITTGGDAVIELWTGGPGSWPGAPTASEDDNVANEPGSGYNWAEQITTTLNAGTYWVLVHMYDDTDTNFNIVLRMQTTS